MRLTQGGCARNLTGKPAGGVVLTVSGDRAVVERQLAGGELLLAAARHPALVLQPQQNGIGRPGLQPGLLRQLQMAAIRSDRSSAIEVCAHGDPVLESGPHLRAPGDAPQAPVDFDLGRDRG